MGLNVLGSAFFLLLTSTSTTAPRFFMEASPEGACEAGIRAALGKNGFSGPTGAVADLEATADSCPATTASGLAHLAAGLLLLDAAKPDASLAQLSHPDVARTALPDYVAFARAEALDALKDKAAGAAYLSAAEARSGGPNLCPALVRASELLVQAKDPVKALETLEKAIDSCPDDQPRLLLSLGTLHESEGERKPANETYLRLENEFPAALEAREAQRRRSLLGVPSTETVEQRNDEDVKRALALFDAGDFVRSAALLRSLSVRRLAPVTLDLVRARLGRALLALGRTREALAELMRVAADSPSGAEAAFYRARIAEHTRNAVDQYEAVVSLFPGTEWAEDALLALANHFEKDAKDDDALPYFRRLLDSFPEGRYVDRAAWHVAWGDFRARHFEEAAQGFERAARLDPRYNSTPRMLYWAGRARAELGQVERARQLYSETIQRYKRAYHGLRAQEALAQLPKAPGGTEGSLGLAAAPMSEEIAEPYATRVKQLLLIDRLDQARAELAQAPSTTIARTTLAFIDWQRGRLRSAINTMKAAHPEYISTSGDALPEDVWRILYPLQYAEVLREKAAREHLDPALVAALICQESTFDAGALSRAGARGLMQVMPHTGRLLAQSLGIRYLPQALYEPTTSLALGTHYLRTLMDEFDGRPERVLAAYNAGPERVQAWTAERPDMSAEEFVESIPFTETRLYVMTVLSSREEYRRLYELNPVPALEAETHRP